MSAYHHRKIQTISPLDCNRRPLQHSMSQNPCVILVLGLQDLSCISPDISKEDEVIMTVAETFETMQKIFNPAAAAGLNKTIQWNISGEEADKWAVKIANQTCEVITGGVEKPDLTLSMS